MANSHEDSDFLVDPAERARRVAAREQLQKKRTSFLSALSAKADQLVALQKSQITSGAGEVVLAEWQSNNIAVTQLPADEHGVLRISIGGGNETPVILNYLRFRGDHGQCVDLLRRALKALEERTE